MIFTNLQLALRQLAKNRLFTAINVLGLAIGVASGLLLFRIVQFEKSYNTLFPKYERIARIVTEQTLSSGEIGYTAGIPIPACAAIEGGGSAQIESTTRVREIWPVLAVPDEQGDLTRKKFALKNDGTEVAFFAEPAFLEMFDWKWLGGDRASALKEINSIVLTKSWAEKCFGSWQQALDKTVVIDQAVQLTVRGIVDDPPVNCDLPFCFLVSYPTLKPNSKLYFYEDNWGAISSNNQMYALLKNKAPWTEASAFLAGIGKEQYTQMNGKTQDKFHRLQPLSDLHFNEDIGTSGSHIVPRSRLWILSSIGILILLMACFNFINLATAQATMRAREVGVRKTLGSSRTQLVTQFMTETFLVVVCSLGVGTGLAALGAPFLERISDVPNDWPFLSIPSVWSFLGLSALGLTFLSGFYPSLVLAGFDPIRALRKDSSQQRIGGIPLRKALVIGQFVVAQALVIGTIITLNQINYMRNLDLGFKKDLVYNFGFLDDSLSHTKLDVLRQQLLGVPGIESVTFSSDRPLSGNTWTGNFAFGRGKKDAPFNVSYKFCDAEYAKSYGIKMAAGRWLQPCDTMREAVVNEELLRRLGVKTEDAVGQEIILGARFALAVVGVVKDFHSHSLHEPLEPLLMTTRLKHYSDAGVKIGAANIPATLSAIQRIYEAVLPQQVFAGQFFDEQIDRFYRDEDRFSYTCRGFAGLAIFISCLGLFGLATHAAARRTKEIGIRKVLGAGVAGITGLLARDFLKLVLLALVIAAPLAYYFMDKWLTNFTYRVDIQWWVFAVAGLGALVIAFVTVSFQSIKAALANPVKSLRSE